MMYVPAISMFLSALLTFGAEAGLEISASSLAPTPGVSMESGNVYYDFDPITFTGAPPGTDTSPTGDPDGDLRSNEQESNCHRDQP